MMSFPSYDFLSLKRLQDQKQKVFVLSSLEWKENAFRAESQPANVTLKDFSNYLKSAEILDNTSINMQGSTIWLPYGMKVRKIFDQIISDKYEEYGLDPYFYPSLVPTEIFDPLDGLYSLKNKMLCVGIEEEIDNKSFRAVLSPTGEATIYNHWSKYIKHKKLPLKMYRNASYFRPVSQQAGMGIFNAAEATGVFEFHAAYSDRSVIDGEIIKYHAMLEEIFSLFKVPRIWSLRPRWTNNAAISLATYGADTLLPNNTSIQIGAIYDQDSIFSERFDISVKENGKKKYTKQIAGFCSRRLLMSQVMITCSVMGKFFLHPRFSPIQIAFIFQKKSASDDIVTSTKKHFQKNISVRHVFDVCNKPENSAKLCKDYYNKGVPLTILIQDKRSPEDEYNVIFQRGDNNQEAKIHLRDLSLLLDLSETALQEIESSADEKMDDYFAKRIENSSVSDMTQLSATDRAVNLFPLTYAEETVRQIERNVKGEIIGFINADTEEKCILTGQNVTNRAILCRRF